MSDKESKSTTNGGSMKIIHIDNPKTSIKNSDFTFQAPPPPPPIKEKKK